MYAADHHGMCASARASDCDDRSDNVDRQIRPTAGPPSASVGLCVVLYVVVRTAARVVALHKHRHQHMREVTKPRPPGRRLLQIHDACSKSVVLPSDARPRGQICTTAATPAVCAMARVTVLHAPLRLIVVVARRAGVVLSAIMAERELINKDKLLLRGLKFHGFHGVKQEEKILGQKFVVDVDAWIDLSASGDIYRIVKDVVEGPSLNLLEVVAHRISSATLLKFPQISAIRVKVGKPHVDVQGIVDYLGVEILSRLYLNNFD
ncbi:hypothetical protein GUJ93_ZPchr0012g18806 [Zizania palustris]|uniref:dihydroneopterin aldolase n=1 Tax=Zizania palustris TaxID=103762 RepID=A0A8J5WX54_ZIZPA|nr:hypothetical protein GUJ93_ZPchr0012g18806 [Zizania palustris]